MHWSLHWNLNPGFVVPLQVGILWRLHLNRPHGVETNVDVDVPGMLASIVVGGDNALVSAEMLSGEVHTHLLCQLRRQAVFLCVFLRKAEDEVVRFYLTGAVVLAPLPVRCVAVYSVGPDIGVKRIDEHVLSENHSSALISDGTGVLVELKQQVGDGVLIVGVMDVQMLQDCHGRPPQS